MGTIALDLIATMYHFAANENKGNEGRIRILDYYLPIVPATITDNTLR
jgi:hypothetical protein